MGHSRHPGPHTFILRSAFHQTELLSYIGSSMTPEPRKDGIEDSETLEKIRSYWLSNLIHDLSGPSFAARGYIRLVLDEPNTDLTEIQRRYLTVALENINKLVVLSKELNKFPARDSLQFDTFSFRALLQQVVADAGPNLLEKNIQLSEDISAGSHSTIGDREKLALAMRDFLAAAVEFTGCGGSINVKSREEDDKVAVRISATGGPPVSVDSPVPDLGVAYDILRLHGGNASSERASDGRYIITGELPILRLFEC